MNSIIISLGGSTIVPNEIDKSHLKSFVDMIQSIKDKFDRIIIVTGGGMTARKYQKVAEELGANHVDRDWIGIAATKINAELLRSVMEGSCEKVLDDMNNLPKTDKKILIGCGYEPGHSTDNDAVILAKEYGGNVIVNISNIEYLYNKDPNKFDDAVKIEKISWNDFIKIVGTKFVPGGNYPFDPIASQQCKELGIKVKLISGKDLENVKKCLLGEDFKGSIIG